MFSGEESMSTRQHLLNDNEFSPWQKALTCPRDAVSDGPPVSVEVIWPVLLGTQLHNEEEKRVPTIDTRGHYVYVSDAGYSSI